MIRATVLPDFERLGVPILGALTGEAGLQAAEIGKIDLFPTRAYVAISRERFDAALQQLRNGRIKGRNFRVRGL